MLPDLHAVGHVARLPAAMPTLEELEAVARHGRRPAPLDDEDRARIAAGRAVVEEALAAGDGGLRRHDRLRAARERADRARGRRAAAGQPAALARRRLRPAAAATRSCAGCCCCSRRRCGAGHSGVRVELVELVLRLLERGVTPVVPSKGSVGSSGDLAPLAHLGLVLIGEGEATYEGETAARRARRCARAGLDAGRARPQGGPGDHQRHAPDGRRRRARHPRRAAAARRRGRRRRARRSRRSRARPCRSTRACTALRGQPGPAAVARAAARAARRQPGRRQPRRLRPRAGPVHAALRAAGARRGAPTRSPTSTAAIERELDAVTDNPLVFPDDGEILSGGNFHGQPLSLPLDHLALAACELASFSERRTYALLSPSYAGLPPFLTPKPGLSSRPDDRPVRRGRAGQREPGARPSGRRGLDPDERRAGGLQLDGRARRAEGAHRAARTPRR